jgi:hypothetical protein
MMQVLNHLVMPKTYIAKTFRSFFSIQCNGHFSQYGQQKMKLSIKSLL